LEVEPEGQSSILINGMFKWSIGTYLRNTRCEVWIGILPVALF